jgi:hypothetical protein
MEAFERLATEFDKSEERAKRAEERAQITANKHLEAIRTQFEEMTKDLQKMIEVKAQYMEVESTDTRKRNVQGKEKALVNQDDFSP